MKRFFEDRLGDILNNKNFQSRYLCGVLIQQIMAIVKTLPPPPMTVEDYRNAAVRHFNTCKILWRYIKLPNTSNLKNLPENEILKNIFYLTGYVAECAIKYRYLTDFLSLTDSHDESHWISAPEKMKRHLTFVLPSSRDCRWSETVIANLCSTRTTRTIPDYLQVLGKVISSSVPSTDEEMQASWEPTTRYHYGTNGLSLPPNKIDIELFYNATRGLLLNLDIL